MYCKRWCVVAVPAVAFAVMMGSIGGQAVAQQPAVPRLFAEWTDAQEPCHDWEGEDSRRIVAHRDGNPNDIAPYDVLEFITPGGGYPDDDAIVRDGEGNVILDLRSTIWLRMSVVHVTSSGAEEVRDVYWLAEDLDEDGEIDLPGPGMTAPTGPDGDVAHFVTIRMTQAPPTDIDNPNKFYLNPNGNTKLCIATGLFNK